MASALSIRRDANSSGFVKQCYSEPTTPHEKKRLGRYDYDDSEKTISDSIEVGIRITSTNGGSHDSDALHTVTYESLSDSAWTSNNNDTIQSQRAFDEAQLNALILSAADNDAPACQTACQKTLATRKRHINSETFMDNDCIIIGNDNTIYGDYLLVIGNNNKVYGKYCVARGQCNSVIGLKAYSTGQGSFASGIDAQTFRHQGFGKANGYLARRNTPPKLVLLAPPSLKRMISADWLLSGSAETEDSDNAVSHTDPPQRLSASQPVVTVTQSHCTPSTLRTIEQRNRNTNPPPLPPLPTNSYRPMQKAPTPPSSSSIPRDRQRSSRRNRRVRRSHRRRKRRQKQRHNNKNHIRIK